MSYFGPSLAKRARAARDDDEGYVAVPPPTPLEHMVRLWASAKPGASVELVLKRHEPSLAPKPVERIKILLTSLSYAGGRLVAKGGITEAKAVPDHDGQPAFPEGFRQTFELTDRGATLETAAGSERAYDRVKMKRVTPAGDEPRTYWEDGQLTMATDEETVDVIHMPARARR